MAEAVVRVLVCGGCRVVRERVAKANGGLLELLETQVGYDAFLTLPKIAGFVMAGRDTLALMCTGGAKCFMASFLA